MTMVVMGGQRVVDRDLVVLVDALVAAVDTARSWEIERLADALGPFGAVEMFNHELRLNGVPSDEACVCTAEGWL